MAVFASAADGVEACLAAQRAARPAVGRDRALASPDGDPRRRSTVAGRRFLRPAGEPDCPDHGRRARRPGSALRALAAELSAERLPPMRCSVISASTASRTCSSPSTSSSSCIRSRGDFPPLETLSRRPNNLPTQTSDFLGRGRRRGDPRSPRGAGGAAGDAHRPGRDRQDTARSPDGRGPDRPVRGRRLLRRPLPRATSRGRLRAVVRTIGSTGAGDGSLLEALKEELRPRSMLLVLDNFEQVMAAARRRRGAAPAAARSSRSSSRAARRSGCGASTSSPCRRCLSRTAAPAHGRCGERVRGRPAVRRARPRGSARTSFWRTTTRPRWRRSAHGSTGCRSRSSWRRARQRCSRPTS